jgi:hypothetical protein
LVWSKNGTPDTLTGTGITFTISDLNSNIFNVLLCHSFPVGASAPRKVEVNGDTGSNYAVRNSDNGSADGTGVSTNMLFDHGGSWGDDSFHIMYLCGVSGQEKLAIYWTMGQVAAGAATAPRRREWVGKGTNTALLSSLVVTTLGGSGSAINSNLSVLGSD